MFLNKLVSLDGQRKTWKLKLEVVAELAEQLKGGSVKQVNEGLAVLAAYLYFMGSGQISCA